MNEDPAAKYIKNLRLIGSRGYITDEDVNWIMDLADELEKFIGLPQGAIK